MDKPAAIKFIGDQRTLRSLLRKSIRRGICGSSAAEQLIEDHFIESISINRAASIDGGEIDGIADVLHFMHNVTPLPGCDYSNDHAFKAGRTEIMEWLERRVRALGDSTQEDQTHD